MNPDERDRLDRDDVTSRVHLRRVLAGAVSLGMFVLVIWSIVMIIVAVTP